MMIMMAMMVTMMIVVDVVIIIIIIIIDIIVISPHINVQLSWQWKQLILCNKYCNAKKNPLKADLLKLDLDFNIINT